MQVKYVYANDQQLYEYLTTEDFPDLYPGNPETVFCVSRCKGLERGAAL
jgi:hypothetical protein